MMREYTINTIVIGSGAAGFSSALRLKQLGVTDFALATENIKAGTSRNTGSDKQTYYKLSLAAGDMDSIRTMAEDLFSGGCVDGDTALCEAALSARGFFRLVELGVPFPCDEFGEYIGYKTDHDRGRRATSVGPYTSKLMTQALEAEAGRQGIRILDHLQAIRILQENHVLRGVVFLDREAARRAKSLDDPDLYVLIRCENAILATGGPAGMYHDSVYPQQQLGSSGIAFAAGAVGKNLTEWQYGIASIRPRWNVSGTYMQCLPRFISTNRAGEDEREFLAEYFEDAAQMLSAIFLKGYQWPFDVSKIFGGSSMIDLLVYQETVLRHRRVFLDFRTDSESCPSGVPFDRLIPEAADYLKRAGARIATPYARLAVMNEPAISFYLDHGIDLGKERLEIAVCAQHNNGGLAGDSHWETNIRGLFAVGEVNGSHGITRPGGTALNAGQVGALRAAEEICIRERKKGVAENARLLPAEDILPVRPEHCRGEKACREVWNSMTVRMSGCGAMIRSEGEMEAMLSQLSALLAGWETQIRRPEPSELPLFYHLLDMLISQKVYLSAMLDYLRHGAASRGSALYPDCAGQKPSDKFPEMFRCVLDGRAHSREIQEVRLRGGITDAVEAAWRAVREIPSPDVFFENQWRNYRERWGIESGKP